MNIYTQGRGEVRLMGLVGYVIFGILLMWAMHFTRLKMGFTDPAFHSFEIMQREGLAIQVNRFGAMVTQAVPLLAYKLGWPLKWILGAYAASFMVLHLLAYHWLVRRYGVMAGWLLVLSYLLFSTDLFYWTISEHQQAMVYVCMWAAWLYDKREGRMSMGFWLVNMLAFVWIIFLYPSSFVTLVFVLGFVFLHQSERRWAWLLGLLGAMGAVMVIKAKVFSNEYDAQKYGNIYRGLQQIWGTGELLPSMKAFVRHCFTDYYWFVAVWVLNLGAYIRMRKWLLFLWQGAVPLGLILLVQLTIHEDGGKFYIDNMYLPLGFMVALPLLYDTIKGVYADYRWNKVLYFAYGGLMLFAGVRMWQVWKRQDLYQQRQAWVMATLERLSERPERCFITTESEVPMDILLGCSWSVGYETLLLSSYENPEEARTLLIVPRLEDYKGLMENEEGRWFGTVWGNLDTWNIGAFKKYFKLKEVRYVAVKRGDF